MRDVIVEVRDGEEGPNEQYESMDGAVFLEANTKRSRKMSKHSRGANTSTENPYVLPSWTNSSANHSYVDIINDATDNPSLTQQQQHNCYYDNMNNTATNNETSDVHTNMPLIPLRPRQLINDRTRATSVYRDIFNYATAKELNAAKLNLMEMNAASNCHYMRYDRKKATDFVSLIKRSHSADDVNQLPLIM